MDICLGEEGILTGSARLSRENRARAEQQAAKEEIERKALSLKHRRKAMEAQIEALRASFLAEQEEFRRGAASGQLRRKQAGLDRKAMLVSRQVVHRNKK